MLRNICGLNFDTLEDCAHGHFTVAQCLNNVNASGMSQHLKNIGFEFSQRVEAINFDDRLSIHYL